MWLDEYRAALDVEANKATPTTPTEMLREFHETYGLPVESKPGLPSAAQEDLRVELLHEEYSEYEEGVYDTGSLVDIADALGDMVYVIYGTALVYGIDLDAVIAEIHRSNMSKLGEDGKPIYREDGKVLKGPNYSPPNLAPLLQAA